MSHFYATLKGTRGEATRCGTKESGMVSHTASWQGAVRVSLRHNKETGEDIATVSLTPWQGNGVDHLLYQGPVNSETHRLGKRMDDRD